MLQRRLDELRVELEKGSRELDRIERQRQELRDQMLRIAGAIQVLEELIAAEETPPEPDED
jgi:prefoldin subunit 5